MNAKLIAASLMAGAIAMPSLANDVNASGEVGYFASVPSGPSMYTRAEVVAELMKSLEAVQPPPPQPPSTITRAQVVAELMTALREGTVPPTAEHADIGSIGLNRTALAGATPTPEPTQSTLAAR
jgi:hypothetical protein